VSGEKKKGGGGGPFTIQKERGRKKPSSKKLEMPWRFKIKKKERGKTQFHSGGREGEESVTGLLVEGKGFPRCTKKGKKRKKKLHGSQLRGEVPVLGGGGGEEITLLNLRKPSRGGGKRECSANRKKKGGRNFRTSSKSSSSFFMEGRMKGGGEKRLQPPKPHIFSL